MSLPKPLEFTVSLIDQITKPIAKITSQMNGLAENYQAATMQMATGAGGVAASAFALHEALMPAIEIDRALGDIRGLGVTEEALQKVNETALDFSVTYGQAATDVLAHSEKLTGALGKMPAHVLAASTEASATLAMVMKSDADTVGSYFKNLYGNYQDTASAMGRDKFVERITGMTAHAKQAFGTTMADMEGMIDGMHSLPSTLGVAMEEQFAVLAMLGKQMGQGDAVTQYTNYLEGMAGAQGKLGLNFKDESGNLLPMLDVLEKIKPLIEGMSGLEARTFLDEAGLGDGSLAIINMIENMEGLKASIHGFKNINGMDTATAMAAAMTDQSQRLEQSWYAVRAAFGAAILPAMNSFMGWMSDGAQSVIWFTQTFPNLTRVLGYAALAVVGLIAAGGMLTLVIGAGKMAMTAYSAAATFLWGKTGLLTKAMAGFRTMMLAVNIAMYANPIGLIVAGVAALVGGVIAAVYWFDDLKELMADTAWGQPIIWAGEMIADLFTSVGNAVGASLSAIFSAGQAVWTVIKPIASILWEVQKFFLSIIGAVLGSAVAVLAGAIGAVATLITGMFNGIASVMSGIAGIFTFLADSGAAMWAGLKEIFASNLSWIVDKLNLLPGVEIDLGFSDAQLPEVAQPAIEQAQQIAPVTDAVIQTAKVLPFPTMDQRIGDQQQALISRIQAMPEIGGLDTERQQQLLLNPQVGELPQLQAMQANAELTANVLPFPAPAVDPVQQQLQLSPQVGELPQLKAMQANAELTANVLPFPVPAVDPVQQQLQLSPQVGELPQLQAMQANAELTANVLPFPVPEVDLVQQQLQLQPQVGELPQLKALQANAELTANVQPVEMPKVDTAAAKVVAVEPVQAKLPKGGVAAQMADAVQRTNHIGTINVYPKEVASFKVSDLELYAS